MPRETISDSAGMYDIRVGWMKVGEGEGEISPGAGYVQLGVESHSGHSIAEMLSGDGETPADFTGLWGTLSEDALKDLIKILRRAQRQAYPKVG